MRSCEPTRSPARAVLATAGGVLAVVAALCAGLTFQTPGSSSFAAPTPIELLPRDRAVATGGADGADARVPDGVLPPRTALGRGLGEADGFDPDGATVFDEEVPSIANLDPALLAALRRAATDAAASQIMLVVESGWRSADYQNQLFREAVSAYGSEEEAARWVATAETSPHVSGQAVDIGPADAAAWLSEHGATYGLCQIYANEPWHYELRPRATQDGCPTPYRDPTHDPRMQQGPG